MRAPRPRAPRRRFPGRPVRRSSPQPGQHVHALGPRVVGSPPPGRVARRPASTGSEDRGASRRPVPRAHARPRTARLDMRLAQSPAPAEPERRGRSGREAPAKACPDTLRAAAVSRSTPRPDHRGLRRDRGSSSQRGRTGPERRRVPARGRLRSFSSGCRNASRAGRWNSASSSRKRTP